MLRKLLFSAVAASTLLATPAMADPITLDSSDIGSSFTINFDGFVDNSSNTIDNLTSTLTLTLDSASSNEYSFSYLLGNTTSGGLTSNLSSFAFDTDPEIASASATGDYSFTVLDSTYPNNIGSVDVCFKAQFSGSCSNGGGVSEGGTGSGSLTLTFADAVDAITLDDFFVRYQGITGAGNVGSASGSGVTSTSSSSGGTEVPEPGMLGMFGAALLAIFLIGRRRRPGRKAQGLRPAFA